MESVNGPVEITKHYLISGRVQGVGFRAFTERQARQLRLRGWVRNLADGRVEALARGRTEDFAAFEIQLRLGPSHGQVDALSVEVMQDPKFDADLGKDFSARKDSRLPCCEK